MATILLAGAIAIGAPQQPTRVDALLGQSTITGPAGTHAFGSSVVALPNGNIAISDPHWTNGSVANAGAVFLYDGNTMQSFARLVGTHPGDQVGSSIVGLANGNLVVASGKWNGTLGAVTLMNGQAAGLFAVSAANSLVGSVTNQEQFVNIVALSNGNYLVANPYWSPGGTAANGAVTWGSGITGVHGQVSAANSLVGATTGDGIGTSDNGFLGPVLGTITTLPNGNYVVAAPHFDNNTLADAGSVTVGNGATGTHGVVSAANSLVGHIEHDHIGSGGVVPLDNGNVVVSSPDWGGITGDLGAATWVNGTTGATGSITVANSLVGHSLGDRVGESVVALRNGNYAVAAPSWDDRVTSTANVGAATWANGTTGTVGEVSEANSVVGVRPDDAFGTITALANGNFIVSSTSWDSASAVDAGAVTLVSGTSPTSRKVTEANSFHGTTAHDLVGQYVRALTNGNFVVCSQWWDDTGAPNAGAVTWMPGNQLATGSPSDANSFHGTQSGERLGWATALANGNYVIVDDNWSGTALTAGAVTWANGTTGLVGSPSVGNSITGAAAQDHVGLGGVATLPNGNYVIISQSFAVGGTANVGAITWASGTSPTSAVVSAANSQLGTTPYSLVLRTFGDSSFVVMNNSAIASGGQTYPAARFGTGTASIAGPMSGFNSVVGSIAGGSFVTPPYDPVRHRFFVPEPTLDRVIVTFMRATYVAPTPARLADTRPRASTVDGLFSGAGVRPAGSVYTVQVSGRGGVPASATDVTVNVVAIDPTAPGYIAVYPCGVRPLASTLNFAAHQTVANSATTAMSATGTICVFTSATTNLLVDVQGHHLGISGYHALTPLRLLDTRAGPHRTYDDNFSGAGAAPAGHVTVFGVAIRTGDGVPATAMSVTLNVTVVDPAADGRITVYSCDPTVPIANSVVFSAHQNVANRIVVQPGSFGAVCISNNVATHLVADLTGYTVAGGRDTAVTPARIADTVMRAPAGTITRVHVAGRSGVPVGAWVATLAVSALSPSASGYLTVFPCNISRPLASNVNFTTAPIAGTVTTRLDDNGDACVANSSPVRVVVDVIGHTA